MKLLIIILLTILIFSSPLFGQGTGILFQYKTSLGFVWKSFGNGEFEAKYKGEITNKEPNGFGFQTFKNGDKYLGKHKNGLPNGQGRSIYVDGSMYLGQFKDGKFHGHGTFIWNDGYYHEGEFKDGTPNGQGIETLPNGQLVGEYKNGKPWNVQGFNKNGEIISKYVNGKEQQ